MSPTSSKGWRQLRGLDGPTLVVLVDAASLSDADHGDLAARTLALCAGLEDRMALLDVPRGDLAAFRDGIGADHLTYGAAYHPSLVTTYRTPGARTWSPCVASPMRPRRSPSSP